jgi:hypothetical protein
VTPASLKAIIEHCPGDLAPGTWIQSEAEIFSHPERFARGNALMQKLLDHFAAVLS